jgi:hypothetical protein
MAIVTLQVTASEINVTQLDQLMTWCEDQTHITIDFGRIVRKGSDSSITVVPAYPTDVNWAQWQAFCEAFSAVCL